MLLITAGIIMLLCAPFTDPKVSFVGATVLLRVDVSSVSPCCLGNVLEVVAILLVFCNKASPLAAHRQQLRHRPALLATSQCYFTTCGSLRSQSLAL